LDTSLYHGMAGSQRSISFSFFFSPFGALFIIWVEVFKSSLYFGGHFFCCPFCLSSPSHEADFSWRILDLVLEHVCTFVAWVFWVVVRFLVSECLFNSPEYVDFTLPPLISFSVSRYRVLSLFHTFYKIYVCIAQLNGEVSFELLLLLLQIIFSLSAPNIHFLDSHCIFRPRECYILFATKMDIWTGIRTNYVYV
jgi:hypothetical protein